MALRLQESAVSGLMSRSRRTVCVELLALAAGRRMDAARYYNTL